MCKHELKNYVGFTDTYQYCHLCGLKESEINAVKPLTNHVTPMANTLQKRIGYTEVKNDTVVGNLKPGEMAVPRGFAGWLPDNKPEGLNSGMAIRELDRSEMEKLYPTTEQYTQYINEAVVEMWKNAAIFGTGRLWCSGVDKEKGVVTYSSTPPDVYYPTPTTFFGVDRTNYDTWSRVYDEADKEEVINITKNEFLAAVDRAAKKQNNKFECSMDFIDELWTEIECDWNGEPEDA